MSRRIVDGPRHGHRRTGGDDGCGLYDGDVPNPPKDAGPGLILLTGATGYVGGRLLRALAERGRPRPLPRPAAGVPGRPGRPRAPRSSRATACGARRSTRRSRASTRRTTWSTRWRRAPRSRSRTASPPGTSARRPAPRGCGRSSTSAASARRERASRPTSAAGRRRATCSGPPRASRSSSCAPRSSSARGACRSSSSASLVERLPVMICPRWVETKAQPIAIEDLVAYLLAALDLDPGEGRTVEIGGADQVTYGDLMREYAAQRGLRRWLIPVPVLTPRLSSLWLGLTTPVYARVGRKLIESVQQPDRRAGRRGPPALPRDRADGPPRGHRARPRERGRGVRRDALVGRPLVGRHGARRLRRPAVRRAARRLARGRRSPATPAQAFAPIRRIGGESGWYYADCALAAPRLPRPARRRRRRPPGPAPPGAPRRGRRARLLAGRGLRARPAAAPRRRDEAARAGLARVRGDAGRRRARPSGRPPMFDPAGLAGLALLVRRLPAARPRLQRDAPGRDRRGPPTGRARR